MGFKKGNKQGKKFEKGNKYWQLRESHGRYKIFEKPDDLWSEACEYFKWIDDNPFHKLDYKGSQVKEVTYPVPKPYTEGGLCIYLGISIQTWENYSSGKEPYADFLEVTKMIKEIIRTQKFEGAASGFFNANIIARDLGLKEKTESDNTGKITIEVIRGNEGNNTVD